MDLTALIMVLPNFAGLIVALFLMHKDNNRTAKALDDNTDALKFMAKVIYNNK